MYAETKFLLINPCIHDFAAYNLWMRPTGLMQLYGFLSGAGHEVNFVDALFPSPGEAQTYGLRWPESKKYHTGKFHETRIEKPDPYKYVPRYYRRFGLPPEVFLKRLQALPEPDCILATSGMTYWYPGVQETIRLLRDAFPGAFIILGGVYATLCTGHAKLHSGADEVVAGDWQRSLPKMLEQKFALKVSERNPCRELSMPPQPVLYPGTGFGVVRLTSGCPFNCSYCASRRLSGTFRTFPFEQVDRQISRDVEMGVRDVAFHDDALLVQPERSLIPLLKLLADRAVNCRFHTPNGLHVRFMTQRLAELLHSSNFRTVRLSYDRIEDGGSSVPKAQPEHLEKAVESLVKAGYEPGEIEVYSLIGVPGQSEDDVVQTLRFIRDLGVGVKPAQYSPTPGTALFEEDCRLLPQLRTEPLLHNPTAAALWGFESERCDRLRRFARFGIM